MTSRWATEFSQHPFHAQWDALKSQLETLEVDDKTVPTSVYELARLKKVVAYLDDLLLAIEPDMTPRSVWAAFHPQVEACKSQVAAYASNRNIAHIQQANEHADNLLTYLKPYFVHPKDSLKALERGAKKYVNELESYTTTFQKKALELVQEIEQGKATSDGQLAATAANRAEIMTFHELLLTENPENISIRSAIQAAKMDIDAKALEITNLYNLLLVGDAATKPTKTKIEEAEAAISEQRTNISGLIASAEVELEQLDNFHIKIFGKKDPATGQATSGLQFELDQRIAHLVKLENEQRVKHKAMFEEIESLLPGATSAGLASAYRSLKEKFSNPIRFYTALFYGALLLLVIAAMIMSTQELRFSPFSIKFIEIEEWDYVLKALMFKAPFILPAVWLAIFSSTRRSQYERLQQEYAHKEALAKSYEGYKKQILDLKGESEELQRALISKSIDSIAYNASVTLDGKHEEKSPIHQLFEKLSPTEAKKLIDWARSDKAA